MEKGQRGKKQIRGGCKKIGRRLVGSFNWRLLQNNLLSTKQAMKPGAAAAEAKNVFSGFYPKISRS